MSDWQHVKIRDRRDAPPMMASIRPGDGEPILCLHGIQGRRQIFDVLADEPRLAHTTLIAIDLPGFGESPPRPRHGDQLTALVDDVRGAAAALDIDRFHVVGHSLGGMIATLLLAEPDSPMLSLVSLEGNLTLSDCGASLTATTTSLSAFEDHGFDALVADVAASGGPSAQGRLLALRQTTARTFYETARSIVSWSGNPRLLSSFVESPVPRCLVVGDRNMHKIGVLPTDIPRYVIPQAGHFMLLENPVAATAAIADWITALVPGDR